MLNLLNFWSPWVNVKYTQSNNGTQLSRTIIFPHETYVFSAILYTPVENAISQFEIIWLVFTYVASCVGITTVGFPQLLGVPQARHSILYFELRSKNNNYSHVADSQKGCTNHKCENNHKCETKHKCKNMSTTNLKAPQPQM